eukprot:IDg10443t1
MGILNAVPNNMSEVEVSFPNAVLQFWSTYRAELGCNTVNVSQFMKKLSDFVGTENVNEAISVLEGSNVLRNKDNNEVILCRMPCTSLEPSIDLLIIFLEKSLDSRFSHASLLRLTSENPFIEWSGKALESLPNSELRLLPTIKTLIEYVVKKGRLTKTEDATFEFTTVFSNISSKGEVKEKGIVSQGKLAAYCDHLLKHPSNRSHNLQGALRCFEALPTNLRQILRGTSLHIILARLKELGAVKYDYWSPNIEYDIAKLALVKANSIVKLENSNSNDVGVFSSASATSSQHTNDIPREK